MKVNLTKLKHNTIQFILDWDAVRKGKMIGYVSMSIAIWDVILGNIVFHGGKLLNIPAQHSMSAFGYHFVLGFGFFYISLCIFSIMLGNYVANKSKTAKNQYMYWCMLLYTLGNVIVSHMFGELSLPSGVLMAGAPMVGWILFNNKGVIICFLFALMLTLPAFFLSFFGVIPYAPIVDQTSTNLHHNMAYNVMIICVILPHLGSLLALAYFSIDHWKRREEHANYLAGTDSLTNVPNRRQFFVHLHSAIEETGQTAQPVSIIMLDLDNFKYINDNFGHITGDKVLNEAISTLTSCLRENDIIGRFGGDEFVVLLPNTNTTVAEKLAERCLDVIRNTPVQTEQGLFNITSSFGLTTLYEVLPPIDADAIACELIQKADEALYQAKHKGKDCLVIVAT